MDGIDRIEATSVAAPASSPPQATPVPSPAAAPTELPAAEPPAAEPPISEPNVVVSDAAGPDVRAPGQVEPSARAGWYGQLWHGPGMVRRALHGGRRAPIATLLGVLIVVAVVGPMLWYRVYADFQHRLVDLAVYRSAGLSLLQGRPLYSYLTPVPQLLPFTYPPFSAIIAIPLAWMPVGVANWVWTLGTLAVFGWLVLVAFRPAVRQLPTPYRPLAVAVLVSAVAWTMPVRDNFRFGQVGIFLTALCLLDCVVPKTRWPRGLMIGFATAIKLTPGVFIVYLWITGRRRAAAVAASCFVACTALAALAMPSAGKEYWLHAVFDSNRLGDNSGTANQALRGVFLRWLPGHFGTALWLLCVAVVAVAGFRQAREASLSGNEVRAVAIVGLLSVVLSPVSWIHHMAGWVTLTLGVVLADGRDLRRLCYALLLGVFFALEVPYWGSTIVFRHPLLHLPGRLLQDSYAFGALFAVWLLGRLGAASRVRTSAGREQQTVPR